MAESNKHIDDPKANKSVFLSVQEALAAGWIMTRYCRDGVACAACETLIACVVRDGSTRCHGCDWAPGSYPTDAAELVEFAGLVRRRYPRGFSVADVRQLRLFLLGQNDDKPHDPRREGQVNRPRVTWRWNAYSRWRLHVAGFVISQGGTGPHLPVQLPPEARRLCFRLEAGELAIGAAAPGNDVLPWGVRR